MITQLVDDWLQCSLCKQPSIYGCGKDECPVQNEYEDIQKWLEDAHPTLQHRITAGAIYPGIITGIIHDYVRQHKTKPHAPEISDTSTDGTPKA